MHEFCERTLIGRVKRGKQVRVFHSICFHAPTRRWPRVGEEVDVVFSRSRQILAVHAAEKTS